ncbi:hypothetical protein ACFQ7A_05360 [Streptomyces sp. NPDC056528]|uniref:tetratricopeptide repeat protein n=1 Tax=Streptomyces sp. NPDC056528 TaxID=3345854 RepID=UPI00367C6A4B
MDLDDLAWQAKNNGGIPPRTVSLLLELGHLDLVIRAAAERGEWFCALAAVRELCAAGEFGRAEAVMAPFAGAGWRPAVRETARILVRAGRVEEGLALVPGDGIEPLPEEDLRSLAELLAETGRVDEAIDLLAPRVEEYALLFCLVEVTEGRDRDDRVLALFPPPRERTRPHKRPGCRCGRVSDPELRARVLERSGRVDEAVRTLREAMVECDVIQAGLVEALAELLQRQGRREELRELAGTAGFATQAVKHYVRALEEHGREAEVEALLREFVAVEPYPEHYRWLLIEILVRQGRFGEAEEVARPTYGHFGNGLLDPFVRILVETGQADRAVRLLEELGPGVIEADSDWLSGNRVWLLGEAGRYEEALAYADALSPEDREDSFRAVAGILDCMRRPDQAIDLLRAGGASPWEVVEVLARNGRAAEGIAGMPSFAEEREARSRRFGW